MEMFLIHEVVRRVRRGPMSTKNRELKCGRSLREPASFARSDSRGRLSLHDLCRNKKGRKL